MKIRINNQFKYEAERQNRTVLLNGVAANADIVQINEAEYHIILNNKSYRAELISIDRIEKNCKFKINNNFYQVQIQDQFDEVLKTLGLDFLGAGKIQEFKAPMPGMILKIFPNNGDEVKKGDNLFVLEAMKMENILKSPADLQIQTILVKPQQKVEKNQSLITFQ